MLLVVRMYPPFPQCHQEGASCLPTKYLGNFKLALAVYSIDTA